MKGLRKSEIAIALIALAIVVLWVLWLFFGVGVANYWFSENPPTVAGALGDSFGGFNALVGALGFLAVVGTFIFQARSLRDQQNDQHRQRFESYFFQMLALMREVREEFIFKYSNEYNDIRFAINSIKNSTKRGPEGMSRAGREVRYWIGQEKSKSPGKSLSKFQLSRVYRKRVHIRYESRLSPYFRVIYTILRHISDDAVLSLEEKSRYGNLLRSQLQSHEVLLLALNGLTSEAKDMGDLICEFRLLKYLPSKMMRDTLIGPYPKEAFEARD
jgi:hypothetical protein